MPSAANNRVHGPTLKIAVLCGCTSQKGGLEVMCLQVAREMRSRGHHVVLVYRDIGDAFDFYRSVVSAMYQFELGPLGLRDPVSSAKLMGNLRRLVKSQDIDLCFATNLGFARTTGVLQLLTGVPSVYHFGLIRGPESYIDPFTSWGIRKAAAAVAPTSHTAESWQAAGLAPQEMVICPNWTDTNRFRRLGGSERYEMRELLGLKHDRPIITYVGRLSEEKGVPTLMGAAINLASEGFNFSLVLAGNLVESYKEQFEAAVQTLNNEHCSIHILSQINNPEDYLSVSDVAVVPGIGAEAFGLTLIEAMSSEVVTIVSKANSFPEIVGVENSDLLFTPGSVQECARLLIEWLTASDARRLERGQKLRKRVLTSYSTANALHYERLFFSVLKVDR
jgi:glycosyltransferase involved in cell wall biosynthesis